MRLRLISESPITRRDFLQKSATALASASPIGRMLVSHGFAPAIVKAVQSGSMAVPFTVFTGTHYGRGDIPMLSDQFRNVTDSANLARSLGKLVGFGADEDAYFTGEMNPDMLAHILKVADTNENVRIHGRDYKVVGDTGEDFIELWGDGFTAHIYKNGIPDYVKEQSWSMEPGTNPIKAWWDGFGCFGGEEPLDSVAVKVMRELGLERDDPHGLDREYFDESEPEEEEPEEPEELSNDWDREYASPMHQWLESRLRSV